MASVAGQGRAVGTGVGRPLPRALREVGFPDWRAVGLAAALVVGVLVVFREWVFRQYAVEAPALAGLPLIGGLFEKNGFSAKEFEDWGHAYMVPLIAVGLVWHERARLRAIAPRVFWPGLLPVLLGVLIYWQFMIVGTHMLQAFGMVLTIAGLVMLVLGPRMFGVLVVPVAYLGFAAKLSEQVMNEATWRLKLLASEGAGIGLNLIGINARVYGNRLDVIDATGTAIPLDVAEACSGMRMVIAFLALSVAVAFFSCRQWWQRVAVILVAVPVALLMNVVRVVVLGAATLWNPDLAAGVSHELIGTLLLVPAFGLFMGIVWCLNRLFVDGEKKGVKGAAVREPAPVAAGAGRGGPVRGAVVGLVVLGCSAVALGSALDAMRVVLRKKPIQAVDGVMLHTFGERVDGMPASFAGFELAKVQPVRMSADGMHELGTDNYLSMNFVEVAPPGGGEPIEFELHCAYYTGFLDQAPHTPERCLTGAGWSGIGDPRHVGVPLRFDPTGMSGFAPDPEAGDAGGSVWTGRCVEVQRRVRLPRGADALRMRVTPFKDPGGSTVWAGYFFVANGSVYATAEELRLKATRLDDVYAYFMKVQFTSRDVGSAEELASLAGRFLDSAFPSLMRRVPDWVEVEAGRYPPAGVDG